MSTDVDHAATIARARPELHEPLARIAAGESARAVFADGAPCTLRTFWRWLAESADDRAAYEVALRARADAHAEEIAAIADERPPMVETQFGEHMDAAFVAWQKNRMDARKWTASRLLPKKYGDRTIVAGDADNPLSIDVVDPRAALLRGLAPKPAGGGDPPPSGGAAA